MLNLAIILYILIVIGTSQVAFSDSDMTNNVVVNSHLTIKWMISSDNLNIDIAVLFQQKSWLGICFNSIMSGADMVIIEPSVSTATVKDYSCDVSSRSPVEDTQKDVSLVSSTISNSQMNVRFQRKLNTGDSKDLTLKLGQSYTFAVAYSSSMTMEKHSTTKTFSISLVANALTTPTTSSTTNDPTQPTTTSSSNPSTSTSTTPTSNDTTTTTTTTSTPTTTSAGGTTTPTSPDTTATTTTTSTTTPTTTGGTTGTTPPTDNGTESKTTKYGNSISMMIIMILI